MTALLIISIIIAILVLLFSVRAFVCLKLTDTLTLYLRVFGIKINILPKKEKKYRISQYTMRRIKKREQKRLRKEAKKAKKKAAKQAKKQKKKADKDKLTKKELRELKRKKRQSRPKIGDMVSLALEILKLFFSTFLAHFHIKTKRIHISVGGADAAQTAMRWYAVYAACGATVALLDKHSNLHRGGESDISVTPDYLSEGIKADIDVSFSMNLFGLLCVVLKTAVKALVGWIKIQPATTATTATHQAPNTTGRT